MCRVQILKSTRKEKKLMAVFTNCKNFDKKTVHFGAVGYSDFTKHLDKKRKERYLARHKTNEKWEDPFTAGSLSRYILWNKPTLQASISDYKHRFRFI